MIRYVEFGEEVWKTFEEKSVQNNRNRLKCQSLILMGGPPQLNEKNVHFIINQ